MDNTLENLPHIQKSDIKESETFDERPSETSGGRSRTAWIIILAFLLLAALGVIVWLLLSGRADQRIHGENLENFLGKTSEESSEKETDALDPGVIVNDAEIDLTNYDSNITITEPGTHTLSGISNYSVLVNSTGAVTLNLNGVTISSVSTAAIANQSENALLVHLLENTTNALTDGGSSIYPAALYSAGSLEISADGSEKTLGRLIVSGRQTAGSGIASSHTGGALIITSGKIMVSGSGEGIKSAGALAVYGGVIWTKSEKAGFAAGEIGVSGGNLLVMSEVKPVSTSSLKIFGGNLVALGNETIDSESSDSTQKTLISELTTGVTEGATVYIKNLDSGKQFNFKAEKAFKTLALSMPNLEAGSYEISVDGAIVGTGKVK